MAESLQYTKFVILINVVHFVLIVCLATFLHIHKGDIDKLDEVDGVVERVGCRLIEYFDEPVIAALRRE